MCLQFILRYYDWMSRKKRRMLWCCCLQILLHYHNHHVCITNVCCLYIFIACFFFRVSQYRINGERICVILNDPLKYSIACVLLISECTKNLTFICTLYSLRYKKALVYMSIESIFPLRLLPFFFIFSLSLPLNKNIV